jgi:hypothetical protein
MLTVESSRGTVESRYGPVPQNRLSFDGPSGNAPEGPLMGRLSSPVGWFQILTNNLAANPGITKTPGHAGFLVLFLFIKDSLS